MKTILITGINGFLGSSIAKKLSNKYQIVGLEKINSNNSRLQGYDFKIYNSSNSIDVIFIDQRIDYIIHTATTFGRDGESLSAIIDNNITFPVKLSETASKHGIKAFINTHTSLLRNTSNYSLSKHQFLDWLRLFQSDMKIVTIAPEHFYGLGASDDNFIIDMIKRMMRNVPSIDLTPGEQKRDFIHIDDLVYAYCLIIDNIDSFTNYSEFEVGSGERLKIKDVLLLIHKYSKTRTLLNFGALPYRENELMQSNSNNEKIVVLGWKPKVKFEQGLKSIIEHFKRDKKL